VTRDYWVRGDWAFEWRGYGMGGDTIEGFFFFLHPHIFLPAPPQF